MQSPASHQHQYCHQLPANTSPRLHLRPPTGRQSCRFRLKDIGGGGNEERLTAVPLPLVVRKHGSREASQYVWDGANLVLVALRDQQPGYKLPQISAVEALRRVFLPQEVPNHYMDYLKWKFLHRVFSSALQLLATQAMFRAIGFGACRTLPSAAALNWILKDGLGRLSRFIYTASMGSVFDANLKKIRFSTSILFTLSIGVELLTPAFPRHFFILATAANIAKSISLSAYIASSAAVNRSFAVADNLGEVSAKSQVQNVCFDTLGLLLTAFLNILCKNNQRIQAGLPFIIYPIFAVLDLFAIYQGLKFVHLQTLTKDRLEILLDAWVYSGMILSPAEVSKRECMYFSKSKGSELCPIRIGCMDPKNSPPMISALTLKSLGDDDPYFICMEVSSKFLNKKQEGLILCLREIAGTSDIIMGLLQACRIRKALLLARMCWCHCREGSENEGFIIKEWFKVVEESKLYAFREINHLLKEMRMAGWAVKNVLFTSQEQERFTVLKSH